MGSEGSLRSVRMTQGVVVPDRGSNVMRSEGDLTLALYDARGA